MSRRYAPTRSSGWAISARALERRAPTDGAARQFAYGAVLAVVPPLAYAAVGALRGWHRLRGQPSCVLALGVPLLKSTFAIRELRRAGEGFASRSPRAISRRRARVCGRWSAAIPPTLDAPLIAAAAIESLAENLSDSIVAPLCYWALFGLPGAVAYRAINTLDAMIGYRGRYEWLGKAGARLDDRGESAPGADHDWAADRRRGA